MTRTKTITRTLYKFNELDNDAKERARDWYRQGALDHEWWDAVYDDAERARDWYRQGALDHEWWDAVYDDAERAAAILGIEIGRKGPRHTQQAIYFSGFSSQGDGACFEGTYAWKACVKAIRDYAPKDDALHAIADTLTALPVGEGWSAATKHRGHYYHSGCMSVSVEFDDEFYRQAHDHAEDKQELPQAEFTAGEETITQALRDFADWVYRQLEKEHDWLVADEQVDDTIEANDYEFTEDGELA